MVDVEELMSKIKSGVWSTQDAFDCIKDLEQEYLPVSYTHLTLPTNSLV